MAVRHCFAMGKDIQTTGVFADGPDAGRLQYDAPRLLFRGAQRRVWDGEALKGVRADGADLVLADGELARIGDLIPALADKGAL